MKKFKAFLFLMVFLFGGGCSLAMDKMDKKRACLSNNDVNITMVSYDALGNMFGFINVDLVVLRLVCKCFDNAIMNYDFDSVVRFYFKGKTGSLIAFFETVKLGKFKKGLNFVDGVKDDTIFPDYVFEKVIAINICGERFTGEFFCRFPNLEFLNIICQCGVNDESYNEMIEECRYFKENNFKNLKELRTLRMDHNLNFAYTGKHHSEKLSSVILDFTPCQGLEFESYFTGDCFKNLKQIKSLFLIFHEEYDNSKITENLKYLENLESLKIKFPKEHFTYMHFSKGSHRPEGGFLSFPKKIKEIVFINFCPIVDNMTEGMQKEFLRLNDLKSLSFIGGYFYFKEEYLRKLLERGVSVKLSYSYRDDNRVIVIKKENMDAVLREYNIYREESLEN